MSIVSEACCSCESPAAIDCESIACATCGKILPFWATVGRPVKADPRDIRIEQIETALLEAAAALDCAAANFADQTSPVAKDPISAGICAMAAETARTVAEEKR